MTTSGYVPRGAYIAFKGTALQSYYRTVAVPFQTADLPEQTSGDDASKKYLVGDKDGAWDFEGVMPSGTAGTAIVDLLAAGQEGTFEVGPEGTAAGKMRVYVNAISKGIGMALNRSDTTTYTVNFQGSGDVTRGTY